MMHFASYGFNKSHSAAYAFLAYETAYLKANYPLEYISAYISHNLSDDAKLNEAVSICKKNGIRLLPPNVMRSEYEFVPEGKDIRFGFGAISGFGSILSKLIIEERNKEQRKMWVDVLKQGMAEGVFRSDLNVDLVYRFIRDTTWVSVRWYQPGGKLTAEDVGQHYLTIVLGGVAVAP